MTVNKITNPPTAQEQINKINEIIDNLVGGGGGLPSQTGKAGLYLQTDGTDASWEGVPGRNIGEIVTSTIPLTDAGLHLLDGSLIQGSGIYSDFVDYIADLYNADPTASYFAQSIDITWTQPVLSADGTVGGDDFAVFADSERGSQYAYYAMDGNTSYSKSWMSNTTSSGNYIGFYNPNPLKVTQLTFLNYSNTADPAVYCTTAGKVQVSSDGTTWTDLKSYTNSTTTNGQTWSIDLSDNTGYYKYYRIYSTSNANSNGWVLTELTVNAVYNLTAEEYWQYCVNHYGAYGKFVYDSVNNTVRLPKISGILEGTTDVNTLGDLIEAGLPNITGSFDRPNAYGEGPVNGAFSIGSNVGGYSRATNSRDSSYVTFNASLSNPIYGNSSTVQPQTIKAFYYIVIATSTKTDIQVDIDEIATDLNGKADVDLSNCTKPHIVETYVNGTSWYNIYSNGWCEQGGQFTASSNDYTLTFLEPFRDVNYNILVSSLANSTEAYFTAKILTKSSTNAHIYANIGQGGYTATMWRACGYIS